MRSLLLVLMVFFAGPLQAQVSYWFQGWQRMGNAADAQSYFMMPGANVNFTYANNRVYINAVGAAGFGVLDTADFVGQGPLNTVLHGGGVAPATPFWAAVNLGTDVAGLLPNANLVNDSVTYNGQTVALGAAGTLTLASADFNGQGPVNTFLHGTAGDPVWSLVTLSSDVTGTISFTNLPPGNTNQVITSFGVGGLPAWSGDPSVTNLYTTNLHLFPTVSATAGVINKGGISFINTYGDGNVFIGAGGYSAGNFTTTGTANVGLGRNCLQNLGVAGNANAAIGNAALANLTTGDNNMAIGANSLDGITTGSDNVGIGSQALTAATLGAGFNVAIGTGALSGSSTANANVGIGRNAGASLVLGGDNTFIGVNAGSSASQLTGAIGSIAIGRNTFTSRSCEAVFGNDTITNTILRGAVVVTNSASVLCYGSIVATNNVIATNLLYAGCVTNVMNGVNGYPTAVTNVPALVTPVGLFGYIGWYGAAATIKLLTAGAYTNIWIASTTSPTRWLTNNFGANQTSYNLTNHIAGYYGVRFGITFDTGGYTPGDDLEAEVFITPSGSTTVGEEHISSHVSTPSPNNHYSVNGGGIVYLASGSVVELKLKNTTIARDVDMIRAFLSIGTP